FRALIERSGRRYVGMDVVQNSSASVDILSTLEAAPADAERFPAVLCTEVLEHVADVDLAFAGLRRLCADGAVAVLTIPFVFPLHMEPYDFRRLTGHGVERLAAQHGFRVETVVRLGGAPEVLATLVADVSILPATGSLFARVKTRLLRLAAAVAIRVLDSGLVRGNVVVNSNCYLSNGVILRAECRPGR
ncbi:MAG: methyltransferase domain-containing protein, partial [Vicinamibacterales bacterium]